MRVVAGGKRFVVFQRNMNCMNEGIGKKEEEASEENNIIIPNRKILTGNKNEEDITEPPTNTMLENQEKKVNMSRMREARNFFVSVSSSNDDFHASPLDISQYSANSILDKKLSFTPKHEPYLEQVATNQILSLAKPPKSQYNPRPQKSFKSSFSPPVNTPIIFSASASVGKLLNQYEPNSTPTKNIGITVSYVHSPSSQSTLYEKQGNAHKKIEP